ncbi:MAG: nitroreductase family protein [Tannerellaceae bacterium]|nr:nitroreductase family protein [Tannerellaceae bacterium]MCD8263970.1 nitroreductase family protein [Tannerellaceae bacterium]
MNLSKILYILFVVCSFFLYACGEGNNNGQSNMSNARTTMDVIHERTSIREYTQRKVSREDLETLVRAGMAAPSAMNKQPWQFIVIDDTEILAKIGEQLATSKMVKGAPAAILVCGDLRKAGEGWLAEYWIQDCSAASQNILLAITEMGMGSVWTSIYPAESRLKFITELLDLPEHIIPLNVIPVGYPTKNNPPKDKWKPENVHWNIW